MARTLQPAEGAQIGLIPGLALGVLYPHPKASILAQFNHFAKIKLQFGKALTPRRPPTPRSLSQALCSTFSSF